MRSQRVRRGTLLVDVIVLGGGVVAVPRGIVGDAVARAASEPTPAPNGGNNAGGCRTALIGTRAMTVGHTAVAIGRGVASHRGPRRGA